MSHSFNKSLKQCLLVDADRLQRFIEETKLPSDVVSVTIYTADAMKREYNELKRLREYSNRKGEDIKQLELEIGRSWDSEGYCSLRFRSSFLIESVSCEARSENEDVLRNCRNAFFSYVEMNAPWWASIGSKGSDFVIPGVIFSLILILVAWRIQSWDLVYVSPLAGIMAGMLCAVIVPRIFPPTSFLIGAGQNRFHKAENLRVAVFIGFLISFIASILATEIYRR